MNLYSFLFLFFNNKYLWCNLGFEGLMLRSTIIVSILLFIDLISSLDSMRFIPNSCNLFNAN
uniref:Uncharacterized protein n=1 Tax=Heliothis armigera entomopoxvirus TaxID=10290 RepID=O89463_HAEPV|nr:orf7 [Heliothis armigera entomopoxvirus]